MGQSTADARGTHLGPLRLSKSYLGWVQFRANQARGFLQSYDGRFVVRLLSWCLQVPVLEQVDRSEMQYWEEWPHASLQNICRRAQALTGNWQLQDNARQALGIFLRAAYLRDSRSECTRFEQGWRLAERPRCYLERHQETGRTTASCVLTDLAWLEKYKPWSHD